MKKRTAVSFVLILIVLAFYYTSIGFKAKVLLRKIITTAPRELVLESPKKLKTYDWKIKKPNWEIYNFDTYKNKIVFINFWNTWEVESVAQIKTIEELYKIFHGKVDFLLISDEEKEPVEKFIRDNKFTFKPTYLIIGEKLPILSDPLHTYIINKKGVIIVHKKGGYDWRGENVQSLLKELTAR